MKTQNKIKKQAKKKAPHPNSRAALKLAGAECRRATLEKKQEQKAERVAERLQRFLWFQEELKSRDDVKILNNEDAREILVRFIARDCAHLARTAKLVQMGKRKILTGRLASIQREQDRALMLLDSNGLEGPNLTNANHVQQWIEWDGDFDSMQRLTTKQWTNKKWAEPITKAEVEAFIEHYKTKQTEEEENSDAEMN